MYVLVRSELLEQFVNTLTTEYIQVFSLESQNLSQQVPGPLSRKPKTFS